MLYPVELRAQLSNSPAQQDYARLEAKLEHGMLVGEEGFEPPTSCSQSRRATRLRYTPKHRITEKRSASQQGTA